MREVRFFHQPLSETDAAGSNHWAGTAPQSRLPFWVVRIVVEGPADPQIGYVCDIKWLDEFVRIHLAPQLSTSSAVASLEEAGRVARSSFRRLAGQLVAPLRLISVQIRFSPYTNLTIRCGDDAMALLTQSFEFSASHRLHCPGLTDEENRRLFGKCSNPHGHGHNYVLEVTVEVPSDAIGSALQQLDRGVHAEVIEQFDHKNLNVECSDFAGLNPTVENIAQVIFNRLAGNTGIPPLSSVRVWETPKTYAECSKAANFLPRPAKPDISRH